MKTAVVCLSLLLTSAPLCAYERDGLTVKMSQEESDTCDAKGGCFLVPKQVLEEVVRSFQERAYTKGLHDCRNAT